MRNALDQRQEEERRARACPGLTQQGLPCRRRPNRHTGACVWHVPRSVPRRTLPAWMQLDWRTGWVTP